MLILYIVWFLETLPFLSILRGMSPGPACLRLWVSTICFFLNVQNAKGKLNVNESLKMYLVNLSVITECKWKGGGGRASLSSNHGDFISPPFSSSSSSIYQQIASFEYLMFIIFKCRSSLSWKRRIMELERTPLTLSLKLSPPSDMSVFFSSIFLCLFSHHHRTCECISQALSATVCWQSCLIKHLVTRTSGWFWDAALGDGWLCQPGQVGEGLRTSSWHSGRGRVLQRQCHWGEDWFSLRLVNWDWNHFRAEELWCSGRSWVSFTSFWTYCNTLTELMTPWQ